jgi:N-methylhydantoinase A
MMPVCFDAEARYVETPVVLRADLAPGSALSGPVIVEEFGSTVPIHPGFQVRVDDYLNLIVTRSEA